MGSHALQAQTKAPLKQGHQKQRIAALVGNPNTGKSTLFNALTGSSQKVGNFDGVTVEKVEGHCKTPYGDMAVVDLPGLSSLKPYSLDESIALDYLLGTTKEDTVPETVIIILDGLTLERGLLLVSQFRDVDINVVVVINMLDLVHKSGQRIDLELLSQKIGVPVIGTIALKQFGIEQLKQVICYEEGQPVVRDQLDGFSPPMQGLIREVHHSIQAKTPDHIARNATFWAKRVIEEIGKTNTLDQSQYPFSLQIIDVSKIKALLGCLPNADAWLEIEGSQKLWAQDVAAEGCQTVRKVKRTPKQQSERIDRVLLHPILGSIFFFLIMGTMFQAVFTWATPMMDMIEQGVGWAQGLVASAIPDGLFLSFINAGVIGGIGNFLVFLPQILILFAFITLLEDSGYLSRASFLMDRFLVRTGLSGRSFIPLLSSFACAVPGIMATRHIPSHRERIVTMMIAPLMTCSARLPVYALLIAAFVPSISVFGLLNLQGLVFLGLYLAGAFMAVLVAWVLKKFWKNKEVPSPYVSQLPLYRKPSLRTLMMVLKLRTRVFIFKVGKIILLCSIILWFLGTFPLNKQIEQDLISQGASPSEVQSELLRHSYIGQTGTLIEPVIRPLGFDWKIGVGILSSFAAREVIIGTMGTIYSLGGDVDEESVTLKDAMKQDTWPDGRPIYDLATVLALLIFFAFAMQCMSTLAVIRREANSRVLPVVAFLYMTAIAYGAAWITHQVVDWITYS